MKTIDCALGPRSDAPVHRGMLMPESGRLWRSHRPGCEACRRTADEMPPLLEPQFQEEARLRRLRRRKGPVWWRR